jgi:adenosylcobinamide-GDP ribazoletransferase
VAAAASGVFSAFLSACLVAAVWYWLTGALHAEGWVDTVDGFSAGFDRATVLRVMKDTHCGAKGVIAAALLVVTKVALLSEVIAAGLFGGILLAAMAGRLSMVVVAARSSYPRQEGGLGKAFVEGTRTKHLWICLLMCVCAAAAVGGIFGVGGIGLITAFSLAAAAYCGRRLGGATGDILGASSELAECLFLAFCAFSGRG